MSPVSQISMVTVLCAVRDASTSGSTVEEGMDKFSCGYDKLKGKYILYLRYKSFTLHYLEKEKN